VLAAPTARGTFRSSSSASNLDDFVAGGGLAEVIDRVSTVEASGIKCHVPVQATFLPRPVSLKALTVRQPPPLGLERIYGPLPAPPNWAAPHRAAEQALSAAASGASEEEVQRTIDEAYRAWCQAAEREVADATGEAPQNGV
jgi:hypothetical protein